MTVAHSLTAPSTMPTPGAAGLSHDAEAGRLAIPVLLYLASVMLPIGFAVGPLFLSDLRVLLLIMVVPLTFRMLAGAYGGILATDILFLLYVTWATLALAVNNPDRVIQNAGSTGLEFIGGYVLARAYIRNVHQFATLSRYMVYMVTCTLPFALVEMVTGHPIIIELLQKVPFLVPSAVPALSDPRFGLTRVQVVFAHPIHYGLFCTIAFSLCFVGMKGLMGDSRRIGLALISAFCATLSLSSGALLAVLLQIMLIGWAWVFRSVRTRWLVLLGLLAFTYLAIDLLSNRTPYKVFLTYATFSSGTAYWRSLILDWGLFNVGQHPIFGIGLNDWVRAPFMYSPSIDNFWLIVAMRYGVPAFAFIVSGYVWALWRIGLRDFDTDPMIWQYRRAWMFSFVGLSFTLVTVDVWSTMYSFVFFIFGSGMWFLTATPGEGAVVATETPDPRALRLRRAFSVTPVWARLAAPLAFRRAPETRPVPAPAQPNATAAMRRPAPRYTRFPPGGDGPGPGERSR